MKKCTYCKKEIKSGKGATFSRSDLSKLQKTYVADNGGRDFYDQKFCSETCKKKWVKDYTKPVLTFKHPWWDSFGLFTDGL
jgi:ribosomal protein L24E